jgi:hypothetical protein
LRAGSDAAAIEAATVLFALGQRAAPVAVAVRAAKKRKLRYAGHAMDHVLKNLER